MRAASSDAFSHVLVFQFLRLCPKCLMCVCVSNRMYVLMYVCTDTQPILGLWRGHSVPWWECLFHVMNTKMDGLLQDQGAA